MQILILIDVGRHQNTCTNKKGSGTTPILRIHIIYTYARIVCSLSRWVTFLNIHYEPMGGKPLPPLC